MPRKTPLTEPCTFDGCDTVQKARGLCNRHYLRTIRYGSPDAGAPIRLSDDTERLAEMWARIDKSGDCWIYCGGLTQGYGSHSFKSGSVRVHRFVYQLLIGPIPEGLQLDHLCHTRDESCAGGGDCPHRACCNPSHLEPVDHATNVGRGARPRRPTCPDGHPYDIRIERRNGLERRCSICTNRRRRENYALRSGAAS